MNTAGSSSAHIQLDKPKPNHPNQWKAAEKGRPPAPTTVGRRVRIAPVTNLVCEKRSHRALHPSAPRLFPLPCIAAGFIRNLGTL